MEKGDKMRNKTMLVLLTGILVMSFIGTMVSGDLYGLYSDAQELSAAGQAGWNATGGYGINVNEDRIIIDLPTGTTLGDIESIAWLVRTVKGYPPHADLILDLDGNGVFDGGKKDIVTGATLTGLDDVLVFEFAYQAYVGPGYLYAGTPGVPYTHFPASGAPYSPLYNNWVSTFQKTIAETNTGELNNGSVAWLYSCSPGPWTGLGGVFGTLADFKTGVTTDVDGNPVITGVTESTFVLQIQVEVDNWLGPAKAYVDISLTGPQGPKGNTGATGSKGSKGATGSQGLIGSQGEQGESGLGGEDGTDGLQGPMGDAGSRGIKGVAGETGPQGATGDAGLQGVAGEAGSKGPKGEQGDTGAVGPKGAQGDPAPEAVAYGGAALGSISVLGLLYMFFRSKP